MDAVMDPRDDVFLSHRRRDRRGRGYGPTVLALGAVALAGVLSACLDAGDRPDAGAAAPAASGDGLSFFEQVSCWFDSPEGRIAICGHMHVPENRARDDSAMIRFPVVVLKSNVEDRLPDPIVVLGGGGPGSPVGLDEESIEGSWELYDWLVFDEGRDLVLMEQRGVGRSEPSLSCPEVTAAGLEALAGGLEPAALIALYTESAQACSRRLKQDAVDLTAYNTEESAADAEDLRKALGYREWNLWGTSYGSRLALTLMQNHPRGIRSAILESVVPPGVDEYAEADDAFQGALEALFAGCARDSRCARDFPELEAVLERLVEDLGREPVTLQVAHPKTLKPAKIVIDGDVFVEIVIEGFYHAGFIAELPIMIYAAAAGSFDLISPLARELLLRYVDQSFSDGLYYSTQCRDEAAFSDATPGEVSGADQEPSILPAVSRLTRLDFETATSICERWGAGMEDDVPAEVESDVPALILAGSYDAMTPPAWGRRAAEGLANSYFFELPGAGHSIISTDYCAEYLALRFLRDPSAEPRDECLEELEGVPFTTLPR